MELGISKINYEDFVKIKALRKGTSGCLGSRQEFFVCDKLEEGECVVFKYENKLSTKTKMIIKEVLYGLISFARDATTLAEAFTNMNIFPLALILRFMLPKSTRRIIKHGLAV